MIDPLSIIFVPGGTAAALLLFVGPLVLLRHRLWRRDARRRNAQLRCARCEAPLAVDDLFLFHGAHVCGPCATTLRRRFSIALPVALTVATLFGISSFSALAVSLASGGPGIGWWLDGRWIPLLLPSVGVAVAAWAFLRLGRRANRERDAAAWAELEPGDLRALHVFPRRAQVPDRLDQDS